MPEHGVIDNEEEFFDCDKSFPSKFYAVAVPNDSPHSGVFSSISEANIRLKAAKGSRLKVFTSVGDAYLYSCSPIAEFSSRESVIAPPGEASPYPSIKQTDLICLRRLIETNDLSAIKSRVSENPLWLLTNYDTPTIIQVRFRYNAIHIAALSGQAEVIRLILSILDSDEFWSSLCPSPDDQMLNKRRQRIVDLYLNSPETGTSSRPIHLASKFGHVECIRVLASHPMTLIDVRDSDGLSVTEVACLRFSGTPEETAKTKHAILRALDEKYIVLVDRVDGDPKILPPMNTRSLQKLICLSNLWGSSGLQEFLPSLISKNHQTALSAPSSFPKDNAPNSSMTQISLDLRVPHTDVDLRQFGETGTLLSFRALLGPLSSVEAQNAFDRWLKPPDPHWSEIRLLDADKGYERYGRKLSTELRTSWTEYWSFLHDFADLKSHYGLTALNNYFAQCYKCAQYEPIESAAKLLGHKLFPKYASGHSLANLNSDNQTSPSSKKKGILNLENNTSTPIRKSKPFGRIHFPKADGDCCDAADIWSAYRTEDNPARVLDDSLDENSQNGSSGEIASSLNSYNEEEMIIQSSSPGKFSPIIELLKGFVIYTPLRWMFSTSSLNGQKPSHVQKLDTTNSAFSHNRNTTAIRRLTQRSITRQKKSVGNSKLWRKSILTSLPIGCATTGEEGGSSSRKNLSKLTTDIGISLWEEENDRSFYSYLDLVDDLEDKYPFVSRWKNYMDKALL